MNYKQFVDELTELGCYFYRQGSNHTIYRHDDIESNLIIPRHNHISKGVLLKYRKVLSTI